MLLLNALNQRKTTGKSCAKTRGEPTDDNRAPDVRRRPRQEIPKIKGPSIKLQKTTTFLT